MLELIYLTKFIWQNFRMTFQQTYSRYLLSRYAKITAEEDDRDEDNDEVDDEEEEEDDEVLLM